MSCWSGAVHARFHMCDSVDNADTSWRAPRHSVRQPCALCQQCQQCHRPQIQKATARRPPVDELSAVSTVSLPGEPAISTRHAREPRCRRRAIIMDYRQAGAADPVILRRRGCFSSCCTKLCVGSSSISRRAMICSCLTLPNCTAALIVDAGQAWNPAISGLPSCYPPLK